MNTFRTIVDYFLAFLFVTMGWAFAYWSHYDHVSSLGLQQYGIDKTLALVDKLLWDAELLVIKACKIDMSNPGATPSPKSPEAPARKHRE